MNIDSAPDVLTIGELKQITRLGRSNLQNMIRAGTFPNLGTSKRFLTSKAALKRYLEQGTK